MSGQRHIQKLAKFPYVKCPHCKKFALMVEWGPPGRIASYGNSEYSQLLREEIAHCTNCDYTDQDYLRYVRDYCDWKPPKPES